MIIEAERIKQIEEGRTELLIDNIMHSPIFAEMKKQSSLDKEALERQERQIEELKIQNHKIDEQIISSTKNEKKSRKQAFISNIVAIIAVLISFASFVVALLK